MKIEAWTVARFFLPEVPGLPRAFPEPYSAPRLRASRRLRTAHVLILTVQGGTHNGLQALGAGSNKKKRERAARLALAAAAFQFGLQLERCASQIQPKILNLIGRR